jgi:RNA polymerase sigma factor (sigma-70 family)
MRTIKGLDRIEIDPSRGLFPYLRQAIRNRVIDEVRKNVRPMAEVPETAKAEGPSPATDLIRSRELEALEAALANLSPQERAGIFMRLELRMGWSEIASELGSPTPDAARVAVGRAVRRLAELMKGSGAG